MKRYRVTIGRLIAFCTDIEVVAPNQRAAKEAARNVASSSAELEWDNDDERHTTDDIVVRVTVLGDSTDG